MAKTDTHDLPIRVGDKIIDNDVRSQDAPGSPRSGEVAAIDGAHVIVRWQLRRRGHLGTTPRNTVVSAARIRPQHPDKPTPRTSYTWIPAAR